MTGGLDLLILNEKSKGSVEFINKPSAISKRLFFNEPSLIKSQRKFIKSYIDSNKETFRGEKGEAGERGESGEVNTILKETKLNQEDFLAYFDQLSTHQLNKIRGPKGDVVYTQPTTSKTHFSELSFKDFKKFFDLLKPHELEKIRGPKGEKGDKGKPGSHGLAGGPGPKGDTGPKGDDGDAATDNAYIEDFSCDASISVRDIVFVSGNNTVSLANSAEISTSLAIGFVANKKTSTTCDVLISGELDGFSGLTPGLEYFLSDVTPGGLSLAAELGFAKTSISVGVARTSTKLIFNMRPGGYHINQDFGALDFSNEDNSGWLPVI